MSLSIDSKKGQCFAMSVGKFSPCRPRPFGGNPIMRPIVFILAAFVCGGPAVAQNWQEYSYPDQFFAAAFPADPQMETTTYQVSDDRSVEAPAYAVYHDTSVFTVPA